MSSRDAVIKTILEALQARGFSEAEANAMLSVVSEPEIISKEVAYYYNNYLNAAEFYRQRDFYDKMCNPYAKDQ